MSEVDVLKERVRALEEQVENATHNELQNRVLVNYLIRKGGEVPIEVLQLELDRLGRRARR